MESACKGPEALQVPLVLMEIFDCVCGALVSAAIEECNTVGTIVALGRFICVVQECKGWDIGIPLVSQKL